MSGLLIKLESLYETLTAAEKCVAGYILANGETIPFQSVYDVAKASGVSIASVSRLAQKVGCSNFKEFKIQIAQEVSAGVSSIYQGITAKDRDEEIVQKVFGGNTRSLEDTLKILNIPELIRAAEVICRCRGLLFFGLGSSGYIAHDSAFRFAHLGIEANAYTDSLQSVIRATRTGKGDVVFGISHSGRSLTTLRCLELAKQRGAVTIGLSNYLTSPLSEVSQIFFCTSFPENKVRAAALSSRVGQICLIDSLYLLVARHLKPLADTELIDELAEKYFRQPVPRRKRSTGRRSP